MTTHTDHFGLLELVGEALSTEGYKFTSVDRQIIDNLIYALTQHRHVGSSVAATPQSVSPVADALAGNIPASTRVYYRHTLVDAFGLESVASPAVYVDTPAGIATPGAPGLAVGSNASGTHTPGTYFYKISAYVGATATETLAGAAASTVIPSGQTAKITLTLPGVVAGVTGYNIYRQGPGDVGYYFLASVAAAVTTYDDTGSVSATFTRFPPAVNSTVSNNEVVVTLPGATPVLPAGYTWNLYRSYSSTNWAQSLVAEAQTGVSFTDTGLAGGPGSPPETSQMFSDPLLGGINTLTADYTLVLADSGKTVEMNVATANTLTVPPNSAVAFAIGTRITVEQLGAGMTTVAQGAGVVVHALNDILDLGGQYDTVTLTKRATNEWEMSRPNLFSTARKAANTSRASTTALANDTGLVLPVAKNATYLIDSWLIVDGAAGDLKLAFTAPAGSTLNWTPDGPDVAATGAGTTPYDAQFGVVVGSGTAGPGIGTVGVTQKISVHVRGVLRTGSTAGDLQLQWAQFTSDATPTTVFADSVLSLQRVA